MSVVPWIFDGPDRTIVGNVQDFSLDGPSILVLGLDKAQFVDSADANVSYDLQVGGQYRDHRNDGGTGLEDGDELVLYPSGAVIVQTEEHFHMPTCRFGHIVPKVRLLQQGISNTSSKVDPGYDGRLLVTVFNLGKRTVRLRRGQAFCALYILDIMAGAQPYGKPSQQIESAPRTRRLQRVRDLIDSNPTAVGLIYGVGWIIALLVGAL